MLEQILDDSGVPLSRSVVVTTAPRAMISRGANRIHDLGPINIHRWWNSGISYAERQGATRVAVLNDDIVLRPHSLLAMSAALDSTGAPLCWSDTHRMTGWAFMLDLGWPVRPDERFRWWYGDDDLLRQALQFGGSVGVDAGIAHLHPNEATSRSLQLQELAAADREAFMQKWGLG